MLSQRIGLIGLALACANALYGQGAARVAAIAVSRFDSCALTDSGAAYCWGGNGHLVLGQDSVAGQCKFGKDEGPCSLVPIPVEGHLRFRAITVGWAHACALTAAGKAYCWGNDVDGQLGADSNALHCRPNGVLPCRSPLPVPVAGDISFRSISAGDLHTCGLTVDGQVLCWGANFMGQLGTDSAGAICPDGPCAVYPLPIRAGPTQRFVAVASGGIHTCAIAADSTLSCWGAENDVARGSPASTPDGLALVRATLASLKFVAVSAGDLKTCATTVTSVTYCWGSFDVGSDMRMTLDTTRITTASPITALTVGAEHVCVLGTDGGAFCWGEGSDGQLGIGGSHFFHKEGTNQPAAVGGDLKFSAIRAGTYHTCGITLDATLYCWGWSFAGQVGDGTTSTRRKPVLVTIPSP
jgi:alpha-tubulin suppressor-like RCC1 family protein